MNAQGDITANFDGSLSVSQLFDMSGVYGFVFDAAAQKTKIAGEDIDFNVKVGDTDLMSFSNGSGALLLSDAGVAGSLSGEVALLDSIPDVTLAADQFTAVFSTIADEVEESIEVGDETFDLTVPGGPFLSLAAEEVTFNLLGELSLEGNILFERQTVADGELMIISFSDVSIAAGFGGEGTGGEALSVTDANGDFVILPGNGVVGRLSFVANVDIPLIAAGATATLFFNKTGSAVEVTTLTGGSVQIAANGPNGSTTWVEAALSISMPGVEVSGVFTYASGGSTTLIGSEVSAFIGDNMSSSRVGLELTNGSGFFYDNGGVISGILTGTVSVVGIDGVSLTTEMTLRYNNATNAISESFTVAGNEVSLEFSDEEVNSDGNAFIQLIANDIDFDLGGIVALSGDFAFTRRGQQFVVTATDASASMNAGSIGLGVNNLDFALLVNTGVEGGSYALYAEGDAALTGTPAVALSGSLDVLANTTGDQVVDFGGAIGSIDYGTTEDTFVFTGNDITISVASFVSISGSIGFTKVGRASRPHQVL